MLSSGPVSIQLDHIVKRHGATVAVSDLSLNIKQGEFFSILGPSGSGKTTLLRLIAGLDQPDEGTIFIGGQSMAGWPAWKRPVNTVFQQYALFPHMTVWDNIAFGLHMQRVSEPDIRGRVEQILQVVQLPGHWDRLPSALSGGEQQRVALARALVNQPTVLLLDEPLGALDQQLRQEMQRELKRIQQQIGITFVCVTHHQEEALFMSDRVAVLRQGTVIQVGTPQELYNHPVSLFVAEFVGLSNQVQGEIVPQDNGQVEFHASGLRAIRARVSSQNRSLRHGTFVIRPERLTIGMSVPQEVPDRNSLMGKIESALYLGGEMHYQVNIGRGTTWIIRDPIISREYTKFSPGDPVVVSWDASEGILLDGA